MEVAGVGGSGTQADGQPEVFGGSSTSAKEQAAGSVQVSVQDCRKPNIQCIAPQSID